MADLTYSIEEMESIVARMHTARDHLESLKHNTYPLKAKIAVYEAALARAKEIVLGLPNNVFVRTSIVQGNVTAWNELIILADQEGWLKR